MSSNLTPSASPFFTIGHSTRSIAAFVDLLRQAAVTLVVDVRTVPRSRRNPQYNADALPDALAPHGMACEHIAALGGLRGKQRGVSPAVNAYWENASFHNYADYAMSEAFRGGLARLRELGHARRCAIMCAEAMWWQCHRRIIADYLVVSGETVFHLVGPNRIEPAKLNEMAKLRPDGTISYPGALEMG